MNNYEDIINIKTYFFENKYINAKSKSFKILQLILLFLIANLTICILVGFPMFLYSNDYVQKRNFFIGFWIILPLTIITGIIYIIIKIKYYPSKKNIMVNYSKNEKKYIYLKLEEIKKNEKYICSNCKKEIKHGSLNILFNCGCLYHKKCLLEKLKPLYYFSAIKCINCDSLIKCYEIGDDCDCDIKIDSVGYLNNHIFSDIHKKSSTNSFDTFYSCNSEDITI